MGGAGPGGRIGHSMVLAANDSRVVMFGGRDNEVVRQHIPRTYEVRFEYVHKYFVCHDTAYGVRCSRLCHVVSADCARSTTNNQNVVGAPT